MSTLLSIERSASEEKPRGETRNDGKEVELNTLEAQLDVDLPSRGDLHPPNALASLSASRKYVLLAVFSIAQFMDLVNVSAFTIAIAQLSYDLRLSSGNAIWVLTAYSLSFASCLLLSGRLADLYSARLIFIVGFLGLGLCCLVMSFLNGKIAFLVFRALGGVFGSLTIPSAIHLIVHMFPNKEQQTLSINLFALSGAVGNALGLIIAGLLLLASWRWLLRFVAIVIIPLAVFAWFLLPPMSSGSDNPDIANDPEPSWKKLDVVGVLCMTTSLICWVLGLTNGNVVGWKSADFIAPFVVSILLFVFFFFYESRLPASRALLPSGCWRLPNFGLLVMMALLPYAWWGTSQTQFSLYFQEVLQLSALETAVRLLPQGIFTLIVGGVVVSVPSFLTHTRRNVAIGIFLACTGSILAVFSDGAPTKSMYFKYCFTSYCIGTVGCLLIYASINSSLIQTLPKEMSGMAGSILNVALQIGAVTLISIQTGLTSTGEGLQDWKGSRVGFWTITGVFFVFGVVFVSLFRPLSAEHDSSDEEKRRVMSS